MKSGLMIMILAGLVFTGCSGKKDEDAGPPMGPVSAVLAKADKHSLGCPAPCGLWQSVHWRA